jgi:hypothetical protein
LEKSKKGKIFLGFFLDLSKAFDKVWRDGLFYLLWKNGIQGVYVGNVCLGKFSLNLLFTKMCRGCHGHDHMVVGFTTTHTISAYHHYSCKFKSRSYAIKFVSGTNIIKA